MPDIQRGTLPTQIPIRPATIQRPDAYNYATPPINRRGNVNGHSVGKNASTFGALGSSFGPYGAALGASVGLASDLFQVAVARKNAEKANEQAERAAAQQAARAHDEAVSARNWNSVQEQIRRMRMAGLSPGLAYGQMSPSAAQPASPEKADVNKADTPKFDNESLLHALQLLINQQNADTQLLAQQSTSELQGSQVDLNLIDKLYKGRQYEATISSILADKDLTDTKKLEILQLLTGRQNLLESQANAADASARQSNANAEITETYGGDLALSEIAKNGSLTKLSKQQAHQISFDLGLTKSNYDTIVQKLAQNGYDDSYAPVVLFAIESIAKNSGQIVNGGISNAFKLITEFFEMSNWRDFLEIYRGVKPSKKRK